MSRIKYNLPVVVLTGRTNVGKSTLFNRLTEKHQAIISNIPGTTRDLNSGICEWRGQKFQVIDTAGLDVEQRDVIDAAAIKQAEKSFKKADLILLIVDAQTGLLPQDKAFTGLLQKTGKPLILIANKADGSRQREALAEFYKLNIGDPLAISAKNGNGTGDMLDVVLGKLEEIGKPAKTESAIPEGTLKVSIIGRPNVGKSSLFNAIAGEERAIVSDIPHTTRDTQDILVEYSHPKLKAEGQTINFLFVDTAGVRRKSKIDERLEKLSVQKALGSMKRADIVLLVLDVSEPISHQDQKLVEELIEAKKSVIIVGNKWDLVPKKTTNSADEYSKYIYSKMQFIKWAPIIFTSAQTAFNVPKLLNTIYEVWLERNKEVTEKELEKMLKQILKKIKPVQARGPERPRIRSIIQEQTNPPIFRIKLVRGLGLHFSYLRFLENQVRERWGFVGTPIVFRIDNP
jgi:GTP-binding protein